MRTLPIAVLLLFPLIASGAAAPRLRHITTDGKASDIALQTEDGRTRVIVEFTTPPLVRVPAALRVQTNGRSTIERFRSDLNSRIAAESSQKLRPSIEREYVKAISGAAVLLDAASIEAVRRLPYVSRVTYDVPVQATAEPAIEPGIVAVRAPEVWSNFGTRGAGMRVAIIDTGIDYMHSALGGGFGPQFKVIDGYDFVNDDADPMDDNDHGTHVAGTVAANSAELLGVAPEAKLIAYKVLGAAGGGSMSDIIAAIERCVDPNGDGDFTDRIDVVNMSLGGNGHPDDPASRAVDNAVAAGVVFVIAAGNQGMKLTIGSPGTADRAVTVGATDGMSGNVAPFSSRGPAALRYSIKPDVLAPGMFVVSAKRGGGLVSFVGTSMASPHVAGVAALLRALHPNWTPDEIKSAIVSTAQGDGYDVMAGGAGRVDAVRAALATTEFQPASLSFGVTDATTPALSRSVTLSVKNRGSVVRTYNASVSGLRDGLAVTVEPSTFDVQPGQTRAIEVKLDLDHTKLPFPEGDAVSFGGLLEVVSGEERSRVPWAIAKGLRMRVTHDRDEFFAWLAARNGLPQFLTAVMPQVMETLVPPATYDLAVVSFSTEEEGPPALQLLENIELQQDRQLDVRDADASNLLTFQSFDERGTPLNDLAGLYCMATEAVEMPGQLGMMEFGTLGASRGLRVTGLPDLVSITADQLCTDQEMSRLYAIEYQPIYGVSASVHRTVDGNDLVEQKLELQFPPPASATRRIAFEMHSQFRGFSPSSHSWEREFLLPQWNSTLWLAPQHDGRIAYRPTIRGASFLGFTTFGAVRSALLRVVDGAVVSFNDRTPPPTAYRGEVLRFGSGAVLPQMDFYHSPENLYLVPRMMGQLDENRTAQTPRESTLQDETGAPVGDGDSTLTIADLDRPLIYKTSSTTHEIDGMPAKTTWTMKFGGPQTDNNAPVLTSMLLLGAGGVRVSDRVPRAFTMTFSAYDASPSDEKTTLRVRKSPHGAWTTVPVIVKDHDVDNFTQRGTIYEAALRLFENGPYDLEMTFEDAFGSKTVVEMTPAFSVRDSRSRGVRH